MSTISGLPAHILWVHFIIVLIPLTAVLLIICSLWSTARKHLIWLITVLNGLLFFLTGLAIKAGEWLASSVPDCQNSTTLHTHKVLGEHSWFTTIALIIATSLLVYLHMVQTNRTISPYLRWILIIVIIIISLWSLYQIYALVESGARAVWTS